MDEKAAVRKAALLLISKLTALLGGELDEELLKTVGMACSDPLVSIRKVAISALSEAFRTYSSSLVTRVWMHSIPRLISDNETSIQEECENLFSELVVARISRAGLSCSANYDSFPRETNSKGNNLDTESELLYPEGLLPLLKEISDGEVSPWVKKICLSLGRRKKLQTKIATALQNIIRTSESLWLNHSMPIEKWTAPAGACELQSPSQQGFADEEMVDVEHSSVAWVGDRVFLLQTISNVSMELPPGPAADLAQNFLKRLEGFNMHSTEELEKSDCAALRNNIVVMMADFCVRYTAMIDCYMSKITKCLRDPSKAPLLAYNSFVEAIFVLNDCNAHTGHSNSNSSRNENRLFSIRGNDENSRSQRMHIYSTLLKQMAPEHLLATFAKVCAEILAAASDGMLSLEDSGVQSVLQDAFLILSSKEIRIQSNQGSSSDAADIEEGGDSGGASAAASKGRAITQAVRKGLIQNAIPIFIEILLKDYKNEIDDILVADRQLQKELIYDMQKYESMKAKNTAADAVATMQRSEAHRSPRVTKEPSSNTVKGKLPKELHSNSKVASAVADAVAAATARSVLREINTGASTPLSAMSVPKLKSRTGQPPGTATTGGGRPTELIESLRRRQSFDSDDDN
ncbi:UNVERIFIED_CONTAM: Condensin-2 complex subunit D3 [Sesamum calycinum]|uniref:Condensin-2 complex subunit D3 n=1 Tax=Sesamum calycinum TaxID=2727403 RepID=A0AAW2R929_9LAMI